MPIIINGSGTVSGLSVGGLPDGTVTTADIADGAVNQLKRSEDLTLGTAQASTSGTSIDFTGIPSWVKRVTVMFEGVSTNGSSLPQIQIGAGAVTTSGYFSTVTSVQSAGTAASQATSGYLLIATAQYNSGTPLTGQAVLSKISGNTWVLSGQFCRTDATALITASNGSVTLSGTLDRVRITTVNGTDTFDAGSINILYE